METRVQPHPVGERAIFPTSLSIRVYSWFTAFSRLSHSARRGIRAHPFKSEIRSTKQMQNPNFQILQTCTANGFGFRVFLIRVCFGFRYSDFGFGFGFAAQCSSVVSSASFRFNFLVTFSRKEAGTCSAHFAKCAELPTSALQTGQVRARWALACPAYLGGWPSLTQRKPVCDRPVSGDDFIRALGR
jgi:hypothetical protein